jgi:hypothetical protein
MSEEYEMTAETTEFEDDDDLDVMDEDIDEDNDEEVGNADADNVEVDNEESTEGDHNAEETSKEEVEEKPIEETRKPKGEKNFEQAEKRRQAERDKIRNDAIIEAVGVNPFTGEKITDGTDVEEYLVMKRIADRGGDPVTEYAKELKNSLRQMHKTYEEQMRVDNERNEYLSKHPNDGELFEDAQFKRFADKLKGVSLANIVEAYRMTNGTVKEEAKKEAVKAVAQANANRKASPGSVKGTSEVTSEESLYSLEQLKKMSPDEIDKNWEKVEKSYAKLQKRK